MKALFIAILILFFSVTAFSQQKSPGSDSIDVIRYSINIDTVNIAAKKIYGSTHIYFQPETNNLQHIPIDLLELVVDSVFLESALNTTWTYNDTVLMIQSPTPLSINDTFHLVVFYHGSPVTDPSGWGGFYFQSPYAYNLGVGFEDVPHNYGRVWFPCIDDFTDKAYYEWYIITDTTQMAVCGGMLADTTHIENEDLIAWHWVLNEPIPTYLASLAVGPYVCVPDSFFGMNDTIPIQIYVASTLVSKVPGTYVHLKQILEAFENRFGPYLWERVGYVGVPFNSGAMEHATNIAVPNACINGNTSYETLHAHELSHHWFGDLVTCATAEEMWINEGWATFCEFIMVESIYGYDAMQNYIQGKLASVLRYAHIDDGGFYPVGNVPLNITYGTTVYEKGALVAHTLRNYMGDSLFFSGVKHFLDSLKFGNAGNDQLCDILSASSGIDLHDFFEAWVLREGFPHFDVDSFQVTPSGGNYAVTVFLRQKLYGTTQYANSNRIELTFMDSLWNTATVTAEFSGASGTDSFILPFLPSSVIVNKNEKTCDAVISYNKMIKTTGTTALTLANLDLVVSSVTDSAYFRVEHHCVAPDPVVSNPAVYRISPNRYWRISGMIPEGTSFTLKLDYSRTTDFMDKLLLTTITSADSLILLYRPDAGSDWVIAPFTCAGNTYGGTVTALNARPGEYALGIGEPGQSALYEQGSLEKPRLYPNPFTQTLYIENPGNECSKLVIVNSSGMETFSRRIKDQNELVTWNAAHAEPGEYFVIVYNRAGQMLSKSPVIKSSRD